jgi:Zn-dependent protease with chaperone function
MSADYVLRLASLCLSSFLAVNFVTGLLLTALSGQAVGWAARMEARIAARFLFALKISPAVLGLFTVLALCIPSYLWLEPEASQEQLGWVCIAASLGCLGIGFDAAVRCREALRKSAKFLKTCEASGASVTLSGERALVIPADRTTVLAGILRPVVVVSRGLLDLLSPEQIEAAVLHERSHRISRDNLKRLAIVLAPGIFPLRAIEQAWQKYAEWAADDLAVAGDPNRCIALAEALVRVARCGVAAVSPPLATSLLGADLEARIERLLNHPAPKPPIPWIPAAAAAFSAAVILLRPATLNVVHRALEALIR